MRSVTRTAGRRSPRSASAREFASWDNIAGIRSCQPVPPSHRAHGPAAGGKYENMLPHARTAILFAPASSALLSSAEQKRSRQYHQNRTAGQEGKPCVQSQFPKPIALHFAAKKDSRFRGCLKWKSGAGPRMVSPRPVCQSLLLASGNQAITALIAAIHN